jgi:hypothetical protein
MYKRRVREGGGEREVDTDWWFIPVFPTSWLGSAASLGLSIGSFTLLPIFAGGSDSKEGPYFAIFPLAGVVKGQFGKKRLAFVLWPLWSSAVDKRYESFHVMWPFIGYWKGRDQVGRRLWPFFGVNRREGRFDRRFYLWPLFARWKVGLDTRYPAETVFFFPFYGRVTSEFITDSGERVPRLDFRTWLFPFFSRSVKHGVRPGERTLRAWHMPWPLISRERGEGLVVRKIWPLWGERKSNDRRDRFVLWPLHRRSVSHDEEAEHRWRSVGLLFYDRTERWVETPHGRRPPRWPKDFVPVPDPRIEAGTHRPYETADGDVRSRRWVQLWPLFHYRRNEEGEKRFQFLSLLPQRTRGRAEAIYAPFWSLYRYERDEDREKRESFVFGLFRHHRRPEGEGPGMRYVNLAGLAGYHRRTGVGKKLSVLGGLIGYERVGGRRAYRFLWAPFGRIPKEVRERHESAYRDALDEERRSAREAGATTPLGELLKGR